MVQLRLVARVVDPYGAAQKSRTSVGLRLDV